MVGFLDIIHINLRCVLKYIFSWIAFLLVLLFVIPLSLAGLSGDGKGEYDIADDSKKISVLLKESGEKKTMTLSDYLVGVVAAEMPASFEYEALKAQAVAARTYAVSKLKNDNAKSEHNGADMCSDFAHCQAYISQKTAAKNWGKNASEYLKKCKNAVNETSGEIMEYDGQPIKAVFHSSSSGKTENARDVWGGDVPYLVSVTSPGEEACPSHESEVSVPLDEFKSKISAKFATDFSKEIIGKAQYNKSGSVQGISVGGVSIRGTQMRSLFNLRSACFKAEVRDGRVVFKVTGNGHGVGMSQYGANYLAAHGYDYEKILKKYYSGAYLVKADTKKQ